MQEIDKTLFTTPAVNIELFTGRPVPEVCRITPNGRKNPQVQIFDTSRECHASRTRIVAALSGAALMHSAAGNSSVLRAVTPVKLGRTICEMCSLAMCVELLLQRPLKFFPVRPVG
jgi:hypothetical protein